MSKKEYYAEYDEDSTMFCVFDTEEGKAYASFASIEDAEKRADELNEEVNYCVHRL